MKGNKNSTERRSPRLINSNKQQKPAMKLAQELIAKKWGVLEEEYDLESLNLQQYLDKYKSPLDEEKMNAIKKLLEVTTKKKRKKMKAIPLPATSLNKKRKKVGLPKAMKVV